MSKIVTCLDSPIFGVIDRSFSRQNIEVKTRMASPFEEVYSVVKRVPRGHVATYGQVSRLLDGRFSAVFVGWALHGIPEGRDDIPWHRIVNAKGGISTRQVLGYAPDLQKQLLIEEGIEFDGEDRCDLSRFQWDGESPGPRQQKKKERARAGSLPISRSRKRGIGTTD